MLLLLLCACSSWIITQESSRKKYFSIRTIYQKMLKPKVQSDPWHHDERLNERAEKVIVLALMEGNDNKKTSKSFLLLRHGSQTYLCHFSSFLTFSKVFSLSLQQYGVQYVAPAESHAYFTQLNNLSTSTAWWGGENEKGMRKRRVSDVLINRWTATIMTHLSNAPDHNTCK